MGGGDECERAENGIISQISTAAQMLLRNRDEDANERSRQFIQSMQNRIWEGAESPGEGPDKIQQEVAEIVAAVEALMRPVLSREE